MGTIDFYDENAEEYSAKTFGTDLTSLRERFSHILPAGGSILDLGCGSGRDSLAFMKAGFKVTAVDGSQRMCTMAEKNTSLDVRRLLFEDLDYRNEFDGVWACSSLLHLPSDRLSYVFGLIGRSLKHNGVFFTCFKKGTFEGFRPEGRYYTDLEPDRLRSILVMSGFEILDIWEDDDRSSDVIWLNVLCQKGGAPSISLNLENL